MTTCHMDLVGCERVVRFATQIKSPSCDLDLNSVHPCAKPRGAQRQCRPVLGSFCCVCCGRMCEVASPPPRRRERADRRTPRGAFLVFYDAAEVDRNYKVHALPSISHGFLTKAPNMPVEVAGGKRARCSMPQICWGMYQNGIQNQTIAECIRKSKKNKQNPSPLASVNTSTILA